MQDLRMEKVKMKGLQEYVDQMKDCLKEQKEIEQHLILTDILLSHKVVGEYEKELGEFEKGLESTLEKKGEVIKEMKK